MRYARWTGGDYDEAAAGRLRAAGYPALLSAVLAARDVSTPEESAVFLERERSLSHSPMLMKDMDRAVERISRALAAGEKMAVFGDYDVDGITATVLLVDYLRSRGADCVKYIPRRIEDGYGLGRDALRLLREKGVTLVITVDCGITGVEEARFAREIGMDLVITDHHECKDVLPCAAAVVDPRRPDCPYPFKHLAGVGVALKLVLALGEQREEALFARYCALAAVGTVADVMQMTGENRTIVHRGLESIGSTDFLGLQALLRETGLADRDVSSVQIGFVLAPRINAAGRMGEAELAADLLLTNDPARAECLARELCGLNRERQAVEQEIFAQAVEQIEYLPAGERSALVLSSEVWHQGVVGIVASRLSEKYSCPSFMIHLQNGMGKGSCRSYGGFNLFAALESCSDLLVDFGGHELAAGFNIREEDIPAFRRRMNHCVCDYCNGETPVSSLEVDVTIRDPSCITLEEMEQLDRLEPYGAGNNRPVFALMGAKVESLQNVGQNRHLKLRLSKGPYHFDAIFFSATAGECGAAAGMRVDAAFHLQVNEFRGISSVQLQLVDLRPAVLPSVRERECLELVERLTAGGTVTVREAARLLPDREQFAALWRAIERMERECGGELSRLPALRRLAGAVNGTESFLRAVLGVEVFAERGLITLSVQEDRMSLHPRPGRRADLEQSVYMRALRRTLGHIER
ncbi:MAG: single-stranded-DNA-specific exonuclease RecJ [Oscillospiraceae bacterium]|jgi:single-stranded-DNA-specific exonuclease|nr:single-stranded-DNA-specific exonuclease RecJ [Oscillospiraceae bacterium]